MNWIEYTQENLTKINYYLDEGEILIARVFYGIMYDAEIKAIEICDTESADILRKYHKRTTEAIKILDNNVIPKIKTNSYTGDTEPKQTTRLSQVDTLENKRAKVFTAKHLSNLTIDFGIISYWERNIGGYKSKYIMIDYTETILKSNGDYGVFSDIISIAIKNGCTTYYGK